MFEIRKHIFTILSALFFILAVIQEHQTLDNHPEIKLIENFRKSLLDREAVLSDYLNVAQEKLIDSTLAKNCTSTFSYLNELYENEGLGFLILKANKLVYWSSNQIAFPNIQDKFKSQSQLINLPAGIYAAQKRIFGDFELIGLIHLKNSYTYENQYLVNTFVNPFNLPSGFKLISTDDKNAQPIFNLKKEYLFSVLPAGNKLLNESQLYFPGFLYLLGLIFLLLSLSQKIKQYRNENFVGKMIVVAIILFLIYWIHIIFGIPEVLNHLEIFSAQYYAISKWLPSLGDFFLITILFFFWSLIFTSEFLPSEKITKKIILPAYLFAGIMYQLVGQLIGNLIINSNISYKLNRITDIDQFSIGSYLAIAMLLFSVFLVQLKVIERTENLIRKNFYLRFHLVVVPLTILLSIYFQQDSIYLLTLFFSVNLLQCLVKRMQISQYSLSYSILFISLFSIISLIVVYSTLNNRDLKIQKVRAINLSSEQDPMAELLLARMQTQVSTDSIIPKLLVPPYRELETYLSRTYFSGYFRKYDIQFIPCAGVDSVFLATENVSEPCFPYFKKMVETSGVKISGSNFYYMNYMNGRVSYFGEWHYPLVDIPNGVSVFIEINSKIASEGIGFPELLMDRSMVRPFRYKYLSYSKYFEDELVSRSGEYPYNYYLQSYNLSKTAPEFQVLKWDGYNHLIYTFNEKNHIIVSNKALTFADYLISFPYIFVFYFVFVLGIALVGNSNYRKLIIPQDLRFRIQISIISVVLISLLLVASGTIYYNIQEYHDRHQKDLQDKMNSISEEIKNRLIYVNSIDPELEQWLYTELYKMSNIFRTDINIYNVKGELVSTSRPEIFAKGVTSERMNSQAFYELSERYQLNYFQPEKIGELSYLSAYEPIINSRGDYLGYLNLPYFTREDELKQGISTFIVAFINLYLILFLASVIVAVLLSNRITQPLSLIREKLKGIKLGKKSELIYYKAEDEIGALVREYNHKVEELAESAELLARSERESAWREMAKQVAHEIKNPLTPMKLNIQYLQRAKEEGNEHYDDFFERVTKNLIEQIDTLSGIATEFSNFAQIPKAKNEVFNLVEVLKNVGSLFEPNKNLEVSVDSGNLKEIKIFADKEQLFRAFLNLIKNGIQAIPADQKGEMKILVQKMETVALIAISDNGTGISKEVQEHLFEPNFTTKTSGMGLGLSIVRNIIQTSGGKIWYESTESVGTTFYIEIPLYESAKVIENNRS